MESLDEVVFTRRQPCDPHDEPKAATAARLGVGFFEEREP